MLDAMTPGAAVFEPEEVDVLALACNLARNRLSKATKGKPEAAAEVARLVHNLGRSRLRARRRLACAADAEAVADEAVDLFLFLQDKERIPVEDVLRPIPRTVPIFPAEMRAAPDTILKQRAG